MRGIVESKRHYGVIGACDWRPIARTFTVRGVGQSRKPALISRRAQVWYAGVAERGAEAPSIRKVCWVPNCIERQAYGM